MTWTCQAQNYTDRGIGFIPSSVPSTYRHLDRLQRGTQSGLSPMGALANECLTSFFFAWVRRHSDFTNVLPSSSACHESGHASSLGLECGYYRPPSTVTPSPPQRWFPRTLPRGISMKTFPLEPFTVRADTGGAVFPPLMSIEEEDGHALRAGYRKKIAEPARETRSWCVEENTLGFVDKLRLGETEY